MIKIYNAAAPTSFEFPIEVGFGYEPRKMSDGSIAVVDTITGTIVGGFEVPWAKDALGNAIPTNFSINRKSTGTYSLIQNVKHGKGTAYPVIADPDWWSAAKCAAELAILFTPAKVFKIKSLVTLIQKLRKATGNLRRPCELLGAQRNWFRSLYNWRAAALFQPRNAPHSPRPWYLLAPL